MDMEQAVRDFHIKFDRVMLEYSGFPPTKIRKLYMCLIAEEFAEYVKADSEDDLIALADSFGDLIYIILAAAVAHGIPITDVFSEIHRSNMTKQKVAKHKKIIKGKNYSPPQICKILFF